jgi:hypothetical protein
VKFLRPLLATLVACASALAVSAATLAQTPVPTAVPGPPGASPDLLPTGEMPLPPSAEAFRIQLDLMLHEHTYLAGSTTDALVNGRREEFLSAQAILDANSVELARSFGALYGPAAEARFLQGWKRHIQDYELYAQAAMNGSDSQKQQARADLDAYAAEAQALFKELDPLVPEAVGAALLDHVHGTLDVIDAQVAKDLPRAFTLGRQGALMTANELGDPLALAIVQQFPGRFPGEANAPDATFRRQTSLLVQADTILGGAALAAAVMGRQPEVDAISGVQQQNLAELTSLLAPRAAGISPDQLTSLWQSRNAALMDYALAVPGNDAGKRQQAVQRLDTFRQSLDQLLMPTGVTLGDRFISQTAYVTAALDALGMHDVGAAKAFMAGAAKQSAEIGVRLALAASRAA